MNPRPLAFTRRTALLAAAGALAPMLDAHAAKAAQPANPADHPPTAWPIASPVPGGIARLALGPASTRPQAFAAEVPVLVLGDARLRRRQAERRGRRGLRRRAQERRLQQRL